MVKLFMTLIGCTPQGRHIEQHDVFFSIAENMEELIPQAHAFWPEAEDSLHFDGFRTVTLVDGFKISVVEKGSDFKNDAQLFFINLGGYKANEFEEFHYKMIVAAPDKQTALKHAKNTAFYKHVGFNGAPSHIDDKFGIDVDDFYAIEDILPLAIKDKYALQIVVNNEIVEEDQLHLGYFVPSKVKKWMNG